MLGGMAQDQPAPEWKFFLVPPGQYTVRDTWFTAGMRATGSKTIVTDNVFVPHGLALRLADLRDGAGPGSALHPATIFHTPFFYYAPISFVAPMLGAAQGAYEIFREWTKTRKAQDGTPMAEKSVRPGADGARRRRYRCCRAAIAARGAGHRCAAGLFAGAPGALGARLHPRLGADDCGDRHALSP